MTTSVSLQTVPHVVGETPLRKAPASNRFTILQRAKKFDKCHLPTLIF